MQRRQRKLYVNKIEVVLKRQKTKRNTGTEMYDRKKILYRDSSAAYSRQKKECKNISYPILRTEKEIEEHLTEPTGHHRTYQ